LVLECFDCFSEGSWILGKTKVFLTSEVFQLLEIERKDAISGLLVKLQASIRVFNAKRQAAQLRERQRVIKKIRIRVLNAQRKLIYYRDERVRKIAGCLVFQKNIRRFWSVRF